MQYYNSLSSFYRSKDWLKLREILIDQRRNKKGDLLCEQCGQPIDKAYDCIAHHVIELTMENVNDAYISLNPKNIQLIHHSCHNFLHCRFEGQHNKKVWLVTGSPLSGKYEFVKKSATPNDIIIDLDTIWQMVSNNPRYNKPDSLKSYVFNIYNAMIDNAVMRVGKWYNCYVISSMPRVMERKRLSERLGAEVIYIDTPKDECIKNLMNNKELELYKEQYIKYINDYFASYQSDDLVE